MKLKEITIVSVLAASIAITVYLFPVIIIPVIQVPLTLQTLMVMLIGYLAKPKIAFISVFLYVFIGALGLPVFSGGTGGFGVLLGPTGGYLFLFPLVSLGISLAKSSGKHVAYDIGIGFLCGIILLYAGGHLWTSYVLDLSYFKTLLSLFPFLIADTIKLIIAYMIYLKMPNDFLT